MHNCIIQKIKYKEEKVIHNTFNELCTIISPWMYVFIIFIKTNSFSERNFLKPIKHHYFFKYNYKLIF